MLGFCPRTLRRLALCAVGITALLTSSNAAWCWETAHGKPDNTGFADVATAAANNPRMVGGLGTIARGAGPVVAPDGTVYIGNQQGKLMSFKADGTPGWSRELGGGQAIVASPAIGSDGSIYVIGVKQYTDESVNPPVKRAESTFHHFTAGGGWLTQTPFPDHNGIGVTTASPNFWRFNGVELVIVPAIYRGPVGGVVDIRLLAFSSNGGIVADQRATSITPETTGGSGLPNYVLPVCLTPVIGAALCYGLAQSPFEPIIGRAPEPPFPGVGIYTNPLGGTPWVIVSDHYKDLIGFTLSLDNIFYEAFRLHENNRFMKTAPVVLSSKHTIIGMENARRDDFNAQVGASTGGALFAGPNPAKRGPVTGLQEVFAAPTQLADGRVVLVGGEDEVSVLNGSTVTAKLNFPGFSIASAAASRSHLFVSTTEAFLTFDIATMSEVARVNWEKGGESPVVIGPQGHVYAIADNKLFVFGRPITSNTNGGGGGGPVVVGGGGVLEDTGTPAPQPTSQAQAYKPPLTTSGNRLFACEELDGDDCGKGDYRSIAKAFCAKNGFAEADDIDVDSKKVKAETLDGQYCSKKKCKVFDQIVCRM